MAAIEDRIAAFEQFLQDEGQAVTITVETPNTVSGVPQKLKDGTPIIDTEDVETTAHISKKQGYTRDEHGGTLIGIKDTIGMFSLDDADNVRYGNKVTVTDPNTSHETVYIIDNVEEYPEHIEVILT
jgi:hypothetical protein